MDRPFIFCHMETSLDGKIMGKYLWIPETNTENDSFYAIAFGPDAKYKFQAVINGRTTVEDNFTAYEEAPVDKSAPKVPAGDFLAPGAESGSFFVVVDGHGRVGWKQNEIDEGGRKMHIVEVLTEQASNAYKAYLRKIGVSYLICGDKTVDLPLLCHMLKHSLHVESALLGGGAVLNWSFVQAGLVDEISLVMAGAADGSTDTQTLFMAKPGVSETHPVVFKPLEAKIMPDNAVWLRFAVGKKNMYDFEHDPDYSAVQEILKKGKARR
jgi:riboflavin biosynthesis pyrimidine reductase